MVKSNINFFQRGSIEIVEGEGFHGFPYHSHDSFMIGVVRSGEAKFVIRDQEYLLGEGMTYIVQSNVGMSIAPKKPYSYLTICIKNGMKAEIGQYKSDFNVIQKIGDKVIGICDSFRLNKLSEADFVGELINVLGLQIDKEASNRESISAEVQNAVNFIKMHVNDKFLLDELAQEVHFSKFHLVRVFKNEMGVTPKHYHQQCKIREAKKSVLNAEAEVDIALELNFSNQSHLCTMFKHYMGITMHDYRNNVSKYEQ